MATAGQSLFSYRVISPELGGIGSEKCTDNTDSLVESVLLKFSHFLTNFFGFEEGRRGRCHHRYYREINKKNLILELKYDKNRNSIALKLTFLGDNYYTEKCWVTLSEPFMAKSGFKYYKEYIILTPVIVMHHRKTKVKYYFPRNYPDSIESFYRSICHITATEQRKKQTVEETSLPLYKFKRGYVIPVCVTLPITISRDKFSKNLEGILDLCSLIVAYNFVRLRMKRRIIKTIANGLFKPWKFTLYRCYRDYHCLRLVTEKNLEDTINALQNLPFKEEIFGRDSVKQIGKILNSLKNQMSKETPIQERNIGSSVELHMFFISIFVAMLSILIMILLSLKLNFLSSLLNFCIIWGVKLERGSRIQARFEGRV